MKVMTVIFASAAVLVGCAGSKAVYTADGRQGYNLDCSGPVKGWNLCTKKAGEICGPAGYDVTYKTGAEPEDADIDVTVGPDTGFDKREMQIVCKTK